ncbi:guanine nucleotide exchange protein smcr8b [Poecilia formosa]|uniref:Smith-Magenis syndrome chromosomal region candidate gene 8 protein homolog n=1 Tax=Poecilia formosa TaxID=48698 RepID=A0A087XEU5_POEFO|nr:PREDICTED: Smith-Magenis syndrome chromosomal region candidate gene 8 protein homolog [Poecilia formosa]
MIGSPDLLPFTGSGGFEEEGEEPGVHTLPEEFSVRLLPPHNPWSTAAQFHRDFILVAEFSEQVGPKPVLTIPNNPKIIGSFDLNHFSVRIMSVDYQASGPGHTSPALSGPRLNFSEDSRVILGDSADDSFAYVHHLTLYDLEARGMVRPFCMAYVCSDQSKLMENFSELSECFSQASDSLKTGNRQAFSSELQRKLQELEYRRRALLQDTHASTGAGGRADELEALEHLILNHRELLRQVTSYPNRKLQQPDFLPYDTADLQSEPSSPCLPSTASCRSESLLKPLEELCNFYFLSLVKNQLADTERRLRGDRSVLRTDRVSQLLSRKLKLTNFLFELCCPVDAEEEEEEDEAERVMGNTVGAVERQSEKHSVELFSCVEEIQIKMEGVGGGRVTPDPSTSTDMMGSVSSSDSIEVLGTEKSYRSQWAVVSDSRETRVGTTDVILQHAAGDAGIRRLRASARRANSEDSIEVLSTTESIVPDDLSAITEEEAEHHTLTNGFEEEEESEAGCKTDEVLQEERMKNTATAGKERAESAGRKELLEEIMFNVPEKDNSLTEKSNEVHKDKMNKLLQAGDAVESRQKKLRPVFDLHVKMAPKSVVAEGALRTPPCGPVRLLSVDEFSDCTSFTSSSEPPSPTTANLTSTCVDKKRKRRRAGLRALRFIKQLSFSQHAIFCLLIGRPLVVIGGDEQLVRKLVDGLRLFLPAPGADGSAVMSCLATPLQLTDLLTWRLVGIHRSSSSASSSILQSLTHLSRYIAVLDLDQKTLRCPSYAGSLAGFLASPHTGISRGLTYLLHLESCLTALANRVLLQTFTAASQRYRAIAEEKDSQQAPQLCCSENDFQVMHFLTDLIAQRHTGHGPPPFRFSYSSVQLHRNTYPT